MKKFMLALCAFLSVCSIAHATAQVNVNGIALYVDCFKGAAPGVYVKLNGNINMAQVFETTRIEIDGQTLSGAQVDRTQLQQIADALNLGRDVYLFTAKGGGKGLIIVSQEAAAKNSSVIPKGLRAVDCRTFNAHG